MEDYLIASVVVEEAEKLRITRESQFITDLGKYTGNQTAYWLGKQQRH